MRYSATFLAWALAGYLPDGILTESIVDIAMGETFLLLYIVVRCLIDVDKIVNRGRRLFSQNVCFVHKWPLSG